MKKQFVLLAIAPVLFLVFVGQKVFAQLKQEPGLYYPYNLVSDDRDVQIYGMPFGIPPDVSKFFEDTLPCIKKLKKINDVQIYDSTYHFGGGFVLTKQDSFFLKMCSPYARVNPGDSITILYLVTQDQSRFNYDALVKYYNGKPVEGKLYYQIKPRKLFGQYNIVGNNTTLEDDPFDVTVKQMVSYEVNKKKLAKLVPVKPVTTGAVTYTQQEKKGGKVVVKILDDATDTVVKKIVIKKDTLNPLAVSQPGITPIAYNFKPALVRSYQTPNLPVVIVEPVSVIDSNLLNDVEKRLADSKKLNSQTENYINKRNEGKISGASNDSAAQEKEIAKFNKEVKVNNPPKSNAIIATSNKATTDSLIAENKKVAIELAYYKKQDSIRNQKEKVRKDSIANVEEQKRISDSTKNSIAIENEKARLSDSVAEVTALALYVLDTTQKGIHARRIADSISTVKHVKDSLVRAVDSVARATDSIKNATASLELKLKRAQEERDSIARIIAVKEKPEPVYRNAEPKVFPKVNKIPYPVIREPEVSPIAVSKIPPQAKDEKFKIIKVVDSTTYDPYGRPVRHSHYVIQKK